ncbi:MAG: hypothetical protein K5776_04445 [Lachnospiraceae bacterium]|nr:hypothetical protein [Lachnospiraceae bacterium]
MIPEKFTKRKIPVVSRLVETLGIVIVSILAVFVRILFVTSYFEIEITSEVYKYAVSLTDKLPDSTMLTFLYASICKGIYNIVPSPYAIYVFNGILEIGVGIFAYYTVKRMFRMRYAICTIAALTLAPYCIHAVYSISPDIFLTFLFSGYFYAMIRICELNKNKKFNELYQILFIVGLGVLAGFIASLDIIGVVLLVITVSYLLMIYNTEAWLKFQNRFVQSLIFTGSFLVSGFIFLNAIPNNGVNGSDNAMNYIYSFIPDGLSLSYVPPMAGRLEGLIIFILAAIAVFSFIRNDYDKGLIYVLIVDFAAVFTFVNFNTADYSYAVNFAYIIIAVIGLLEIPSFILTDEQIYEREKEKQKREAEKRRREYERDLAKGKGILNLNESEYGGNPPKEEVKPETTKVVSQPPVIPDAYKNKENDNSNERSEESGVFGRRQRAIIPIGVNSSSAALAGKKASEGENKEETKAEETKVSNDEVKFASGENGKETKAEIANEISGGSVKDTSASDNTNEVKSSGIEENVTVSDKTENASGYAVTDNVSSIEQNAGNTDISRNANTESINSESQINVADNSDTGSVQNQNPVNMVSNPVYDEIFKNTGSSFKEDSENKEEKNAISAESSKSHESIRDKDDNEIIDSDLLDENNILTSDLQKRDKVLPSRRDYRTAHVIKSKEEEEMLSRRNDKTEDISLITGDPALKATPMIKNPVPSPKAHVPKELTYDYDLKDDQLDFDITDLKGKDYYDI